MKKITHQLLNLTQSQIEQIEVDFNAAYHVCKMYANYKIRLHQNHGKLVTIANFKKTLTKLKKLEDYAFIKRANSTVVSKKISAQAKLLNKDFFKSINNSKKFDFDNSYKPNFLKYKLSRSKKRCGKDGKTLNLPKIGMVEVLSSELYDNSGLNEITIKKGIGNLYFIEYFVKKETRQKELTSNLLQSLNIKSNRQCKTKKQKLPIYNGYIHPSDLRFAKQYNEYLASLSREKLFLYLKLVEEIVLKYNKHTSYVGSTYTSRYLDLLFGRGGFKEINNIIKFINYTNYSKDKKFTRCYYITDEGREFVNKLTSRDMTNEVDYLEDIYGNKYIPYDVRSKKMDDVNSKWSEVAIPAYCEINVKMIQKGKYILQRWRDYYVGNTKIRPRYYGPFNKLKSSFVGKNGLSAEEVRLDYISRRMSAMHWLDCCAHSKSLPYGFVATEYKESNAGRLYSINEFNLQNIPREVRTLAFDGLYDYDLKNCHYTIVQQVANKLGMETPTIDYYVKNTAEVRTNISNDLNLNISDVKACLLALIYGAKTSSRVEDAIPSCIGTDNAKKLYEHDLFKNIISEVREASKLIIDNSNVIIKNKKKYYKNEMGKLISSEENNRKILAHLVQGIEANILFSFVQKNAENIVLLIHDGWITEQPIDVPKVENDIYQATGLKIVIEENKLNCKWEKIECTP